MNHNDFITFQRTLARILPSIATWLSELAKEQGEADVDVGTIRSNWARILGDCKPEEYRDVLMLIASQDITIANWQDLPGVVRREVIHRRPKKRNEYLENVGQKFVVTGEISLAYKEMRECNGDAEKIAEVKQRWLDKWSQEQHREPRLHCIDCFDVGMVTCWHVQCLRNFRNGKEVRPMTMAVKCSCEAGSKWGDNKPPADPMPRFKHYGFCRYVHGDMQELQDWFDWRKSQGIEQHPNYNNELVISYHDGSNTTEF